MPRRTPTDGFPHGRPSVGAGTQRQVPLAGSCSGCTRTTQTTLPPYITDSNRTQPNLTVSHRTHLYPYVPNRIQPYQSVYTKQANQLVPWPMAEAIDDETRGRCVTSGSPASRLARFSLGQRKSDHITRRIYRPTHQYPWPSGYHHGRGTEGGAPTLILLRRPSLSDWD